MLIGDEIIAKIAYIKYNGSFSTDSEIKKKGRLVKTAPLNISFSYGSWPQRSWPFSYTGIYGVIPVNTLES